MLGKARAICEVVGLSRFDVGFHILVVASPNHSDIKQLSGCSLSGFAPHNKCAFLRHITLSMYYRNYPCLNTLLVAIDVVGRRLLDAAMLRLLDCPSKIRICTHQHSGSHKNTKNLSERLIHWQYGRISYRGCVVSGFWCGT